MIVQPTAVETFFIDQFLSLELLEQFLSIEYLFYFMIGLALLWLNGSKRPILETIIAPNTIINVFFLNKTLVTDNYGLLI